MVRAFVLLLFLLSASALFSAVCATDRLPPQPQNPSNTGCLSYEPSVVEITGVVVRKITPDERNRPETYWLLNLSQPICVDKDPSGPDLNYAQTDIRTIQLVFLDQKMYATYKDLLG